MGNNAVNAQITPQPRGGDFIAHRVVAGDTLEMLAARYLGDRTHWTALQSHNRVDNPFQLRPGSCLKFRPVCCAQPAASVEFVQGDVRSSRSLSHLADTTNMGSATSQAVQKGQLLQEGDSLKVPANAFVSVRLADGSLVRVQSESDVCRGAAPDAPPEAAPAACNPSSTCAKAGFEASVPKQTNGERRFWCTARLHPPACAVPSFWC